LEETLRNVELGFTVEKIELELIVSNGDAIVLRPEDIADDISIGIWVSDDLSRHSGEFAGDGSEEFASVVSIEITITVGFSLVFKTSIS